MDPKPVHELIKSRMESFLDVEMAHGGKHENVDVEWQMLDGRNVAGEALVRQATGLPIKNSKWFAGLMIQVRLLVKWDSAKLISASLTLKSKHRSFYVMQRRGLILFHNGECLELSAKNLRMGRRYNPFCLSEAHVDEDGIWVTWLFNKTTDEKHPKADWTTFSGMCGGSEVYLTLSVKPKSVLHVLCHDILDCLSTKFDEDEKDGPHVLTLTNREERALELAQQKRKNGWAFSDGILTVKCEGSEDEFTVTKGTLAASSPVFVTCFLHPESLELQSNCYTITHSTPGAVKCFLMYLLVPELQENCIELAKLAHRYQVPELLDLCELKMLEHASSFADSGLEGLVAQFETLLDICRCASLLELTRLLALLHFVIGDLELKVMHLPVWPMWKAFLKSQPDFASKCLDAVDGMKSQ